MDEEDIITLPGLPANAPLTPARFGLEFVGRGGRKRRVVRGGRVVSPFRPTTKLQSPPAFAKAFPPTPLPWPEAGQRCPEPIRPISHAWYGEIPGPSGQPMQHFLSKLCQGCASRPQVEPPQGLDDDSSSKDEMVLACAPAREGRGTELKEAAGL